MAYSNAKFKKGFLEELKQVDKTMDAIIRKVALQVLTSLVMKSPVDTGAFRGNWFVQPANNPVTTDATDKSGGGAIAVGAQVIAQFKIGSQLFILNHLPYSVELEFGSSKQAPMGMVRITVAEFDQYLSKIAGALRK